MTSETKTAPQWVKTYADQVHTAIKAYIDKRDEALVRDLQAVSRALSERDAARKEVDGLKRQAERHSEHLRRLESRVAKLERGT